LDPLSVKGEHVFGVGHVFSSFNDTFIISIVYDKMNIARSAVCFHASSKSLTRNGLYMQHVTDLS
jgi:hypothetical protein